jgi:hypothetical protein
MLEGQSRFNGRQILRLAAVAAAVLVSLAACAPSDIASKIGAPRIEGSITSMTIPALWAGSSKDGMQGGVELATVSLDKSGPGAFTVDLSDSSAQGAGPSWQAASASAAAFAALAGGTNPQSMSVKFGVTGPIDGPSAGGLMAVALIAASTGGSLLPGHTMTGTISPEGSIGVVGYVSTKLKAAHDAGFNTVVIPEDTVMARDGEGNQVNLVDFGKQLGLTVIPVRTVNQAFEAMTGKPFASKSTLPSTLPAAATATARESTLALQSHIRSVLSTWTSALDPKTLKSTTDGLATSESAGEGSDWAKAYGIATVTLLDLDSDVAQLETDKAISSLGLAGARAQLLADAEALKSEAARLLATPIAASTLGLEQKLTYPYQLSWLTWAIAQIDGVLSSASTLTTNGALVEAAKILSEQRLNVEQFYPDARRVGSASQTSTAGDTCKVVSAFTVYSNLLNQTGKSSLDYLSSVLRANVGAASGLRYEGLLAALSELAPQSAETAADSCDFGQASTALARAITYYSMSAGVVAGSQAYSLRPVDTTRIFATSASSPGLSASLELSQDSLASLIGQAQKAGLNTDEQLWTAAWASAAADHFKETPLGGLAQWVAINELWGDVITLVIARQVVG